MTRGSTHFHISTSKLMPSQFAGNGAARKEFAPPLAGGIPRTPPGPPHSHGLPSLLARLRVRFPVIAF